MDGTILSGIIQRSLIGWYCILLIFLVRLLLKRISRKYCYYLWMVVFLNLCIPFSIFSSFSLIPQRVMDISIEGMEETNVEVSEETNVTQNIVVFSENGALSQNKEIEAALPDMKSEIVQTEEPDTKDVISQDVLLVWGERIWILGMVLLGFHSLLAIIRLNNRIKKGYTKVLDAKEHIVILHEISSPILWGFFSPTIYLPEDLEEGERNYIIEHEKCHRRRKDYLVKPLLYGITIIYWFHPLVWLAYHLCCQDMEMSCDEIVLEKADKNIRKEYAYSLLKYAAKQNGFLLNPLTFGEPSIHSRIEYILKYKKKSVYVTVAAMVVVVVVGIGLISRPVEKTDSDQDIAENSGTDRINVTENSSTDTTGDEEIDVEAEMTYQTGAKKEAVIHNNGGEVLEIDGNLYYMSGKPLYTNGKLLYTTHTNDDGTDYFWQYELDESGYRQIMPGTIVGISEEGDLLYYLVQNEEGENSFCTYHTGSETTHQVYEGEASYLAVDGNWVYHYEKEDSGLYFSRNKLEKSEEEQNLLGMPLEADEISCFYATDSHLLFAAGIHEGSAGYFYGDFYSYNLESKELVQKHVTDDDKFVVFNGKIYYSKYSNEGDGESALYCVDFDLNNETLVGKSMEFLKGIEEQNKILVSKDGKLLSVSPDGSEEECIFDALETDWEIEEYDKLYFREMNVIDNRVFARVEQWGYREENENGWRDSLINSQNYQISLDGSQSLIWDPDEILEESKEEIAFLSNPVPGQPCDNPEEAGWDLENVIDVRDNFSRMPYTPEEGTEDYTYLLGKTESYILYGKGDYENLLLECGGKYAEVRYDYTSNYMTPLELFETDIDRDGRNELAIKFRLQQGTGISIDTFLLADFGKDNDLYVHQYLDEEFTGQLAEPLSFEKTENGIQAMVNGENVGPLMENPEDGEPFNMATVGAVMHFYYDSIQKEIQLSGDIMFLTDNVGAIYTTNGNDVTATVNWDGEKFFLSDFTSRNRYLDEQVEYDLSEFYGMNPYDVNVNYDSSNMNQETIVITAEVLKTEADTVYDELEIHLKRSEDSWYSGWEIEGILSKSPRMKKTTISFIVEGMKEEVPVVLYRGKDYSIYIPDEGWQMTEPEVWESIHNENVKLQVTDYKGESVESLQEQLLEEGYRLSDNPSELTKYDEVGALIKNVRIFTYNDNIKGVFYSYPLEAEEGFGTRLERIISTFGWD